MTAPDGMSQHWVKWPNEFGNRELAMAYAANACQCYSYRITDESGVYLLDWADDPTDDDRCIPVLVAA